MLKFIRTNWRTSAAGICAAIMAITDGVAKLCDGDPLTQPDFNLIVATVVAAVGLLFARDARVTSKQLGLLDDD